MTSTEQKREVSESADQEQFPAVSGDVQGEIEKRSADGANGNKLRKVYVAQGEGYDDPEHPSHAANKAHFLEEAIQRGLHPKAEPELVDAYQQTKTRRGLETWEVVYEVEVEPASIDEGAAADTVTPRVFIEKRGGDTQGEVEESTEEALDDLNDNPQAEEAPRSGIRRAKREG